MSSLFSWCHLYYLLTGFIFETIDLEPRGLGDCSNVMSPHWQENIYNFQNAKWMVMSQKINWLSHRAINEILSSFQLVLFIFLSTNTNTNTCFISSLQPLPTHACFLLHLWPNLFIQTRKHNYIEVSKVRALPFWLQEKISLILPERVWNFLFNVFLFAVTSIFILLLCKRCITETALQRWMMLRGWQPLLPKSGITQTKG